MVKKIFHIADLHIRRGNQEESRYLEYENVFANFVRDLKGLYTPNESLLVICGDIFHHKLQISPPGIRLFNSFINDVKALMPVIIIQGNHDLLQENNEISHDIIEAILLNSDSTNVTYLRDTGTYEYENVSFGLVSIQDMLKIGCSSGLVSELPAFPEPHNTKFNIALSHCSIKNCYLNNNTRLTEGIPIDWFRGYKIALLGDIHLQTAKYNKKNDIYYGYPGSLVQQDFGESVFNHGFLCWDLSDESNIVVTKHHVRNEYAKCNIKLNDAGECMINGNTYITVDDFLTYADKPRQVHARLYAKTNVKELSKTLKEKFQKHDMNLHIDIFMPSSEKKEYVETTVENVNMDDLSSSKMIIDFIDGKMSDDVKEKNPDWNKFINSTDCYMIHADSALPKVLHDKLQTKNDKISKTMEDISFKFNKNFAKHKLSIKEVKFDWILSYGKENVFEFSNDRIVLINAPNGYGKTAFFEILLLGLFGEPIPSRYNKSSAISVICKKKPKFETATIEIRFYINNDEYVIKRNFMECVEKKTNITRLHCKNATLHINGECSKTGANVINAYVNENLCSIKDFLLSTMITQNADNDFFKLKLTEQISLLDSVLNIDYVNEMCENFKLVKKEYKDIKNHFETYLSAAKPEPIDCESYSDMKEKYENVKETESRLQLEIEHNGLVNSVLLKLGNGNSVSDKGVETRKPLPTLVTELNDVDNEIVKLNFEVDDLQYFPDVDDITINQFILHSGPKRHERTILDKKIPIKKTIIELRNLNNKMESVDERIEENSMWKPATHVSSDLEDYKRFKTKYDTYVQNCECWILTDFTKTPVEQKISTTAVANIIHKLKATTDKRVFSSTDDEMNTIIKKLKKATVLLNDELSVVAKPKIDLEESKRFLHSNGDMLMSFSETCWACKDNAKRIKTTDDSNIHKENVSHWASYNKYCDDLSKIQENQTVIDHLKSYKKFKAEMETYQGMLEECKRWDTYVKHKKRIDEYIDLLNLHTKWEKELPNIKQFDSWFAKDSELSLEKQQIFAEILDKQRVLEVSYEHQCKSNKLLSLQETRHYIIMQLQSYVNKYKQLKTEFTSCQRIEKELFVEIECMARQIDMNTLFHIEETKVMKYIQLITTKIELFDHLMTILLKYKSWVYNDKLLPIIVNKTNTILKRVFNDRKLSLGYTFSDNTIVWSVMDEDNEISMEKLSGAQSFAMGLCFRLALSTVGIAKFKCDQLFIDEGFCSFDQTNLAGVPNFLTNLKTMFDEIIIVTHLNDIKKTADTVVDIKREDSVSKIYHIIS
jgi:DNA repair exonuclease SbcCD ATPase subunit